MRTKQRSKQWPPLLIHAISPRDRAKFYAFRAALLHRDRMMPRIEPYRHPAPPLGSETFDLDAEERSRGCIPPISDDLMRLQITERWSRHRFLPAYVKARRQTTDPYKIADEIYASEMQKILASTTPTPTALELVRRVHLAVAILARSEGIDAQMPYQPSFPRSPNRPPGPSWLLALLTGWP